MRSGVIELVVLMREFVGMSAITIAFLVAAGILVACNRTVSRGARHAFLTIIVTLIVIVLADCFMFMTDGMMPELGVVHTALMTITFIFAPAITVIIAQTIFPDRSAKWMTVFLLAHAVFQLANIAGGFVFWVDDNNTYHRGPLYPIYMAAYSISALYLIVQSIRAGRVYQTVNIATLLGILACMLTGVLIQVYDTNVRTTWPAVSMCVVLYFLFYCDMITRVDPLTKLLNRRSYEEMLEKPPLPCIALVIDVNDFKNVNDTYGHAFGDKSLESVGQIIRHTFGGVGQCYRTGGDEFAVVMTKRLDEVDTLANQLKEAALAVQKDDGRMPSVSVGYAVADKDCPDIKTVFEAADQAMYQAKSQKVT